MKGPKVNVHLMGGPKDGIHITLTATRPDGMPPSLVNIEGAAYTYNRRASSPVSVLRVSEEEQRMIGSEYVVMSSPIYNHTEGELT